MSINYSRGTHRSICRAGGIDYVVQAHGSVLDALTYAENNKKWPRHLCSSLRTDNQRFHGTPDWGTALAIARSGWPEGRAYLRKACAVMPKASMRERIFNLMEMFQQNLSMHYSGLMDISQLALPAMLLNPNQPV